VSAAEALTTPTLLSQGERREKNKDGIFWFPSLPLGERGQGSEGRRRDNRYSLGAPAESGKVPQTPEPRT